MSFEELVEQAREAQYSHLWVDAIALKALIRERDALKAENEALKAEDGAPQATPARFGVASGAREIVNDRVDALESAAKTSRGASDALVRRVAALESRKILDEQRMDHLDRRLDDFIARIDEIERAHLDTAP